MIFSQVTTKSKTRTFLSALFFCCFSWDSLAQSQTTDDLGFDATRLKALEAQMSQFVTKNKVKGLSILLSRHGKVASTATFGEIKEDSIVRIFSMTKPITGVAMMILFEEGKWRLEDPITKFIPEFKDLKVMSGVDAKGNITTVPAKRPPTLGELMSHTAGFGYGLFPGHPVEQLYASAQPLDSSSLQEMIEKIAKIPLRFQPGTDWFYSVAVDIQGYLVEKLSGQKLGDFLADRIFKPLKMNDTDFQTGKAKADRLITIYATDPKTGSLVEVKTRLDGTPLPNYIDPPKLQSGGGGLISTLKDYSRFAQMILNGGLLDGVRIISAESVKLMGTNVLSAETIARLEKNEFWSARGAGFGLDFAVVIDPSKDLNKLGKGTIYWGGAAGTWFWIDPANDLYFVGIVQTFDRTTRDELRKTSRKLVYEALIPSN